MANKRSLKHVIDMICEELFAQAVAASLYGNDGQEENADALLFAIIRMRDDFISRVSHPEPGMKARAYYTNLRESFAAQVGEIVDQIDNL